MTTAYLVYFFILQGLGLAEAIPLAMLFTVVLGLAVFEVHSRFAVNPFSFMMGMLLSSLLLQYVYSYLFGGEEGLTIPGIVSSTSISFFSVSVNPGFILSGGVSLALMVAVWLWIERTSMGRRIRATSSDPEAARLFGIDVRRTTVVVFVVSTLLVSTAAILLVPSGTVTPEMWLEPFVIAFAVSIMAGLGDFRWVLPAAFLISFGQVIAQYALPYDVSDIVAFALVVVAISIRPTGLGGGKGEH